MPAFNVGADAPVGGTAGGAALASSAVGWEGDGVVASATVGAA